MMVWLLFLALSFSILVFLEKNGARESLLRGSVLFGAVLLIATELFSAVSSINTSTVALFWFFFDVSFGVYFWKTEKYKLVLRRLVESWRAIDRTPVSFPIIFILVVTFLVALISPPNNYDSMTYHMTRVAYWMQNHTVAHFPTHNTRQIFMGPWAEYAILHLQLLSFGSDRFANLVQWCAFPGAMIAASLLVARFGGGRSAQWFAALLVATTPMAILQASSTQTDLICAYWVLVFAWVVLDIIGVASFGWKSWLLAGLVLALAVSTKGTAYIYCAPFLGWLAMRALVKGPFLAHVKGLLLMAGLMLALNAPHYYRNIETFSHPLGDPVHLVKLSNQTYAPWILFSNLLRNASLHLQTPFPEVNGLVQSAVVDIHRSFGLDVMDKRTTWDGNYYLATLSAHEDFAGNPLHFFLISVTLALVVVRPSREIAIYFSCAIIGFLGCLYKLKWQVWGTRFHSPFFLLCAPVLAAYLLEKYQIKQIIIKSIIVTLLLYSFFQLFYNTSRPIFITTSNKHKNIVAKTRISQYFNNQRGLETAYYNAVLKINTTACSNIGIVSKLDSWEYPFVAIQRHLNPERELAFHHLFVANPSARLASNPPEVCAILALDQDAKWRPAEPYSNWQPIFRRDRVMIFASKTP